MVTGTNAGTLVHAAIDALELRTNELHAGAFWRLWGSFGDGGCLESTTGLSNSSTTASTTIYGRPKSGRPTTTSGTAISGRPTAKSGRSTAKSGWTGSGTGSALSGWAG